MLKRVGLVSLLVAVCFAQHSGIDRTSLDPTCKPCQDFWRYTNGGWLDKNPIPARFPSWGPASVLSENTRANLRGILESAKGTKVGDVYAACMDTAAIDAAGVKPLEPYFDRVAAIGSAKELSAGLVAAQSVTGIGPFTVQQLGDLKNSKDIILYVDSGGLSLPERDYYFKDDARSKQIREEFVKHVARMQELAGETPEAAAAQAKTILAFETRLADATKTAVQRRDLAALYHRVDFAGLTAMAPDFDWKLLFNELHLSTSAPINVMEPDFLKRFNQQLTSESLADWKTWLRWRLLTGSAGRLAKPIFDENFHFRSTVLTGVTEQQPRWRTCVGVADGSMGEELGKLYVDKYFPPQSKQRARDLVENLRVTLGEQIQGSEWLAADTKRNALLKLKAFNAKVGYPDKWRDYSGLKVDAKSYFANAVASYRFEVAYQLAKIGKPIDRTEWGMTPPTLNAYYNPLMNEIVFPAGILQPPFFDGQGDDATNYGAIGAVIGHEMGHGFDDQGSQFDAEGNMKNWWTPADLKSFTTRAGCVVEQYDALDLGDGAHHKGKLVVGEAMGDLNGLKLAYRAYHKALKGKEAPVIDGFTGDQRFFLAFARVWGSQQRPEAVQLQTNTDPHPISKYRAIGTLQNMPEFRKAFECQGTDAMVRADEKLCSLW
ncbi:MAG TPA: M13 family metallopeptidase [Candidatus Solibacter sp.]|jgi:predicted metalloendopeptidase